MTITVNQGMLTNIKDDIRDGWDGAITYSIDVDPGTLLGDLSEFIGFEWDPNVVGTSAANIAAIIDAVELWDDVIGESISFVFNNDDEDIIVNTVDNLEPGVGATTSNTIHTLLPNDADIFFGQAPIVLGNYAWATVLHEFGHALGLQHPGAYDASDGGVTYEDDREYDEDTVQFSLMSYFDPSKYNASINWNQSSNSPQTPMIYDILAIQPYYNADTATRLGSTTYGFNSTAGRAVFDFTVNTMPVLTIWDAGGDQDVLDLSGFSTAQRIDLSEGSYSDVGPFVQNVGIAFNTWIENAVGGLGADRIDGNSLGNRLDGGLGADTLSGLDGGDTLIGGGADDILFGGAGADTLGGGSGADLLNGGADFDIAEYSAAGGETITIRPIGTNPSAGRWLITGAAEAAGDTLAQIEAFRFGNGNDRISTAGTSATFSFNLDGRGGNDIISGGEGADKLTGGAGSDSLRPGAGVFQVFGGSQGTTADSWIESLADNDQLVVDRTGDANGYSLYFVLNTSPTGGYFSGDDGSTARGIARINYFGGVAVDYIQGGRGNDVLEGMAGNDTLFGGEGNDTLRGGLGSDWITGGNGNDRIETGGGGDSNLLGDAGNDTLVGSDEAERLWGGADNDKLYGNGGNDTLYGEAGNDLIEAGLGDDYVDPGLGVENLDGGIGGADRLIIDRSSTALGVSFYLNGPAGSDGTRAVNFETVEYYAGSGADTVRGWSNADTLIGNNGNDVLEGMAGDDMLKGGDGKDTLRGGLGYDFLSGGNGNDRIETGGGGDIAVYGEAGKDTLVGSDEAERLLGGADNDKLYGYGGNDVLYGEAGDDLIEAGLGDDYMNGGEGSDRFVFEAGAGTDRIVDFDSDPASGQDILDVASFAFGGYRAMLAAGVTIVQTGFNTVINFETGNPVLTLDDVLRSTIGAADFIF